jgi:hypothetical protein
LLPIDFKLEGRNESDKNGYPNPEFFRPIRPDAIGVSPPSLELSPVVFHVSHCDYLSWVLTLAGVVLFSLGVVAIYIGLGMIDDLFAGGEAIILIGVAFVIAGASIVSKST